MKVMHDQKGLCPMSINWYMFQFYSLLYLFSLFSLLDLCWLKSRLNAYINKWKLPISHLYKCYSSTVPLDSIFWLQDRPIYNLIFHRFLSLRLNQLLSNPCRKSSWAKFKIFHCNMKIFTLACTFVVINHTLSLKESQNDKNNLNYQKNFKMVSVAEM
jgi:hypothetical protein